MSGANGAGQAPTPDTFNLVFGGTTYPVPALTLGKVYRIAPRLMKLRALSSGTLDEGEIEPLFEALDIAIEGVDGKPQGFFRDVRGDLYDLLAAAKELAEQCGISRITGEVAGGRPLAQAPALPSAPAGGS